MTDAYSTRIQRNSKFTANFVKRCLLLLLWMLFHCKVKTSHAQHMTTRSKNERSAGRHSSKSRFLLDTKYANHWVTKKPTTSQFASDTIKNIIDYTNCCNRRSKRSHENSERRNVSGVQKMRQGQNAREGEGGRGRGREGLDLSFVTLFARAKQFFAVMNETVKPFAS